MQLRVVVKFQCVFSLNCRYRFYTESGALSLSPSDFSNTFTLSEAWERAEKILWMVFFEVPFVKAFLIKLDRLLVAEKGQ